MTTLEILALSYVFMTAVYIAWRVYVDTILVDWKHQENRHESNIKTLQYNAEVLQKDALTWRERYLQLVKEVTKP